MTAPARPAPALAAPALAAPARPATLRTAVGALIRGALAEAADLLLPVDCAGCGRAGPRVCAACRAAFGGEPFGVVPAAWPGAPPVRAAAAYAGPVRRCVVAWKDRDRHDLLPLLAGAAARAAGGLLADLGRPAGPPLLLVPVPSAAASRRRRGEDVVHALALGAAVRLRAGPSPAAGGLRVLPALHVARRVSDQAGLSRRARAANLDGALAVRRGALHGLSGRDCLVLDDVVTTGATAREATRALTSAGARVVGVAAVCATPLRHPAAPPDAL